MTYLHIKNAISVSDLDHSCKDHLSLRVRDKVKGTAYAYQCMFCGEFRGGEVGKKSILQEPPPYDKDLEEAFFEKHRLINSRTLPQKESINKPICKSTTQIFNELDDVIEKYCIESKVDKKRAINLYLSRQREKHIKDEYIGLWSSEDELHNWFIENFSEWFEIYHEVNGYGLLNGRRRDLRIDFVIKAKQPLISDGFTDQYLGVEVKYLNPKADNDFHGKSSKGVFQALSYWYSSSRWDLPLTGSVELASVLVFSNLSFQKESECIFNTYDKHYREVWRAYLSLANHANVGELLVRTNKEKLSFWAMEYSSTRYYSMYKGKGFVKGNQNVINKTRIGSAKK